MRTIVATTIVASVAVIVALPIPTVAEATKPKPKMAAGGMAIVTVTNWREADLLEMEATQSGSANWKKVIGALKAGQRTLARVPQTTSCRVDLRGKYTDGKSADLTNFDVCTDKTVDLVN